MPNMNVFKINEVHLEEIRRLKNLETKQYVLPHKTPSRVRTIPPQEHLTVEEWFNYLKSRKDRKINLEVT